MEREEALAVLRVMVHEYASSMAWHPDDIDTYYDEALQALSVLGLPREALTLRLRD